jgi:hypothetical protein
VGWHTLWRAVKVEAAARVARPGRLVGVETLGVDEHVWRPGRFGAGRDVTVMVDLTRGAGGVLRARLLDMAPGRSGTVYKRWLDVCLPAAQGFLLAGGAALVAQHLTTLPTRTSTSSRGWRPPNVRTHGSHSWFVIYDTL